MALKNKRGMVTLEKDGVQYECVLESVPVWEARGWKLVEAEKTEEKDTRLQELNEQARKEDEKAEAEATATKATAKNK